MENLSDRLLMEAYFRALELELAKEFVFMIREEMDRRSLGDSFQLS
ncbi:MAG TPA: sporulation histidine kinase inhibitor Sda [Bacillales bacterium]